MGVGGSDGAAGSFLGTRQLCPSTMEALQGRVCDTVHRSMHRCAHTYTHTRTNTHTWVSVYLSGGHSATHSKGPAPGLQGWSVVVQAQNPPSPPAREEPHAHHRGSTVQGPVKVKVVQSCPPKGPSPLLPALTPRLTAQASAPLHPSPMGLSSRGSAWMLPKAPFCLLGPGSGVSPSPMSSEETLFLFPA